MKWAALVGSVVCVLAATSVATAKRAHSLGAVTHSLYSAILRADTTVLRGLLSDDLRWVSSSGAVVTKQQLLAAASQPIPHIQLDYPLDLVKVNAKQALPMIAAIFLAIGDGRNSIVGVHRYRSPSFR